MPETAAERLERAFLEKADGVTADAPRIGVFGDGLPEALVRAAGGVPVDIKAATGPVAPDPRITPFLEPFIDHATAGFLHRLGQGAFERYSGLVFSRDDTAGLTAYQYALELRRMGVLRDGPPLHLWNLVHTASEPAHRFNLTEAHRLNAFLAGTCGRGIIDDLAEAVAREDLRRDALARLRAAGLSGRTAFIWRNAGRWLDPQTHADLIDSALPGVPAAASGPAIGLVGSAVTDPDVYAALDLAGRVVVDLQPYGQVWPETHLGGGDLDSLLRAVATHPLHVRTAPPERYRTALLDRLGDCNVVVALLAPHEESVGWEIPALTAALAARGVPLVDLGFLPETIDAAWSVAATSRVRAAAAAGVPV